MVVEVIVELLVEGVVLSGLVALEGEDRADVHGGDGEEREYVDDEVAAQDERATLGEVHVDEEVGPRAVVRQVDARALLVQAAVADQPQAASHDRLGHEPAPDVGEGGAVLLPEAPHGGGAEHEGEREREREHGEHGEEGEMNPTTLPTRPSGVVPGMTATGGGSSGGTRKERTYSRRVRSSALARRVVRRAGSSAIAARSRSSADPSSRRKFYFSRKAAR